MAVAFCLDCGHGIYVGSRPVEGQQVTCSHCGTKLEIISVEPLELDWVYLNPVDVEEEWDWQWREDEDWEEEERKQLTLD